jgi:hypothetical protein
MDLDTNLLVQGELHAHDRGKQGDTTADVGRAVGPLFPGICWSCAQR